MLYTLQLLGCEGTLGGRPSPVFQGYVHVLGQPRSRRLALVLSLYLVIRNK